MKISKREFAAALLQPFLSLLPAKKGVVILTLHNIYPQDFLWFDKLIRQLSDHYEFINPSDLTHELLKTASTTKILLTFDDGFLSNRMLAETVLKKYGVKAIFFITEGFVGIDSEKVIEFVLTNFYPNSQGQALEVDLVAPMSWVDVKWLSQNGHMIGAHTKSHPVLSSIKIHEQLVSEIVLVADRIETLAETKINCFAFPFGTVESINYDIINMAKDRFEFVFSNVRGCVLDSPDRGFLFRQNIVPGDSMSFNRAIVDGRLDWKYRRVRQKAKDIFPENG